MPMRKSAKKGQGRHNKQWVREHGAYRSRLPYGAVDKMTGRRKL